MKKKLIYLFGASGFVGKNLIRDLNDVEIIGIDKHMIEHQIKDNLKFFYHNDVFQLNEDFFPNEDFYVINLVAELGSASSDLNILNNLKSAEKIVSLLKHKKAYCRGIIHFSSISAIRSASHYGKTKKASEDIFINSGYNVIVLRSEMIIGNGARSIEKFSSALKIFPLITFLPNGGNIKRFPIDIIDVVKIVGLIIKYNFFKNKIYYLVSSPVLVRDMARNITKRIIIPIPKFSLFFLARILEKLFSKPSFTYDNAVGICTDTKFDGDIISEDVIRKK